MTSLKRNLFITGTPYQFIAAFNLCKELYTSDAFENIIYFSKSDKTDYDILESIADFNGKIICFNIDPKFSDCLDGFLVVDVQKIPAEMLEKIGKNF